MARKNPMARKKERESMQESEQHEMMEYGVKPKKKGKACSKCGRNCKC